MLQHLPRLAPWGAKVNTKYDTFRAFCLSGIINHLCMRKAKETFFLRDYKFLSSGIPTLYKTCRNRRKVYFASQLKRIGKMQYV